MKIGQGAIRDKYDRYYSQDELVEHLSKADFAVENVVLGEALGMVGDMEPWTAVTSSAKL